MTIEKEIENMFSKTEAEHEWFTREDLRHLATLAREEGRLEERERTEAIIMGATPWDNPEEIESLLQLVKNPEILEYL